MDPRRSAPYRHHAQYLASIDDEALHHFALAGVQEMIRRSRCIPWGENGKGKDIGEGKGKGSTAILREAQVVQIKGEGNKGESKGKGGTGKGGTGKGGTGRVSQGEAATSGSSREGQDEGEVVPWLVSGGHASEWDPRVISPS